MITSNTQDLNNVLNDQNIKLYTFNFRANYSNDLSQMYFDDFKSEIKNQSLWFDSYLVIFENEALKNAPFYKKSHLAKMTKQSLYDLCEQYEILGYCYSEYEIEDNTKETLIKELMRQVDNEKYYTHHFNESSYHDLDYDFSIYGHCPGDSYKIKLIGNVESYINSDHLTNLFYNSPIEGSLEISLNYNMFDEISFYELENFNEYDYFDKNKLIETISNYFKGKEYHSLLVDYLNDNVPTELSHDY